MAKVMKCKIDVSKFVFFEEATFLSEFLKATFLSFHFVDKA